MEKHKKNQIKKTLSWALILSLVAALAALPMLAGNEEPTSGPQASILSATVENRDIATAVLGGGTLDSEESVAITLPAAVKVKEYLVRNGDVVTEGQPVASVDRVSVMTAITQVQETMESIREELNSIRKETEATQITATAGGTVKKIYAAVNENVQDVILRDGALAVLSLDGLMAVRVQRNTKLTGGDRVCVTLSDGTELEGRVESNLEGILTVTVEDDGFDAGQEVKVTTEDGDRIGSGELYIHSPWNVVAYSGTVSSVRVSEGATVSAGHRLFDLKNEGHTVRFESLSGLHREYEELMLELFEMYQSETVTAPQDGMISGADENGAYMLSDMGGGWSVTLLSNGPGGDENAYVNYVGQVVEVGTDGLIMKMNPQAIAVTDYLDLSGVPLDTDLMTQITTYNGNAPIYDLREATAEGGDESVPSDPADPALPTDPDAGKEPSSGADADHQTAKEWVRVSPYSVTAGDILLFAGDNSGVVWVVRISSGDSPQTPQPSQPNGNFPQAGGRPGMDAGMNQEETEERYALDTVTIASVTAQNSVTVSITVDELDILKLRNGQTANVSVEALPGQQFTGTVTSIAASGENEGGNSKFAVTVTLDKIPQMLPGMSASVSIVLTAAEQVPSLPVAALTENGTQVQVYTGFNEETGEFADPVTVTTGASDGEYVQILSGIAPGQKVYYPYYDTLVISYAPDAGGFSAKGIVNGNPLNAK